MFRKLVATLLLGSVSLLQIQPALAQTSPADSTAVPAPAAPTPAPAQVGTSSNASDCMERGGTDGARISTGGAFTVGLTCGVLLGLIGTGIAYFTQAEPKPSTNQAAVNTDPACRLAYEDAYGEAGKKKKKRSALIGGLIGTAVIVTVITASGN